MIRPAGNQDQQRGQEQVPEAVASHRSVGLEVLGQTDHERELHELRGLDAEAPEADPALGAEEGLPGDQHADEEQEIGEIDDVRQARKKRVVDEQDERRGMPIPMPNQRSCVR